MCKNALINYQLRDATEELIKKGKSNRFTKGAHWKDDKRRKNSPHKASRHSESPK